MAKLTWDGIGQKLFEAGIDQVALYVQKDTIADNADTGAAIYETGVAWNGVTGITENREGGEVQEQWADNIKYISLLSPEDFGLTIEAFTYPDEFMACDGSAVITNGSPAADIGLRIGLQKRKPFALVYRTKIGSDTDDLDHGYKLHIVYGCKAQPSERGYETINDSPEAMTFSWEVNTTPIKTENAAGTILTGYKPTAFIELDSTVVGATKMAAIEATLFGSGTTAGTNDATMMLPHEVWTTLTSA